MATTTNALVEIKDTEQFLKLCNADSIDEIAGELERLKLDSLPSIYDNVEQTEKTIEAPAAEVRGRQYIICAQILCQTGRKRK